MTSKNITEISDEQLLKNEKIVRMILILAIIAAALLLGAGVYLTIVKKKFNALTILPMAMLAINISNFNNLKQIKIEKTRRGI